MKKIILTAVTVAAAAASINAQAATTAVCSGGGAAQTVTSIASAATSILKTAFTPKCSANVILQYEDATTYMRVGSASVKGKNAFGGSTMGDRKSVV